MKVLLMPHRYSPARGGVETWAYQLARGLQQRGHTVTILTRDERAHSALPPFSLVEEEHEGLPVHRVVHHLGLERSFRDSWADDRWRSPIEAALLAVRPDLVHVAHPDGWGVLPFRVAGRHGLPTVATLHDYKWICSRGQMVRPPATSCDSAVEDLCVRCVGHQLRAPALRSLLRNHLPGLGRAATERLDDAVAVEQRPDPGATARQRWRRRQGALLSALHEADAVTSPSQFMADRIAAHGLTRSVEVIANGSDLETGPEGGPTAGRAGAGPVPNSAEMPSRPLRVGFFGNPHPSKGLEVLLSAWDALPPGSAELHLHGPSASDLPGGPRPGIVPWGPYAPEEAAERLAEVDVVAIPSTWDENQPMVAIEARRAGRPLIVSNRGGLPELVQDGVDGWVIASAQAEAWAERLSLLASRPAATGEAAARAPVARTAQMMAKDFERLYEELPAARTPQWQSEGS